MESKRPLRAGDLVGPYLPGRLEGLSQTRSFRSDGEHRSSQAVRKHTIRVRGLREIRLDRAATSQGRGGLSRERRLLVSGLAVSEDRLAVRASCSTGGRREEGSCYQIYRSWVSR